MENEKNTNSYEMNTIFRRRVKTVKIKPSKFKDSKQHDNSNILKNGPKSSRSNNESINDIKKIKKKEALKEKQLKNFVFEILLKDSNKRNSKEILIVADYLSKHYKYFIDLNKNNIQIKVDKLVKICKLEKFNPNDIIIFYGDIADKFYIVLEGKVSVYIPEFIHKEITLYEFLNILEEIKTVNKLKYERIKSKNKGFNFDNININEIDPNSNEMKVKYNFYLENEEKLGEYGEGYSFGEIALIKKTTRNATIKAIDDVICLSISKNEYDDAIEEFQSKKLTKDFDSFKKIYPFFDCFTNEKMIKIFNCLSQKVIYKGDYLFHQNDIDDYIYLTVRGNFEIYSYISYSWLNEYYNYIDESSGNILYYILLNKKVKYNEVLDTIKKIKIKAEQSPMKDIDYKLFDGYNISNKNNLKDNLYYIKNDEEQINNKKNIFKILLNKVDYNYIFGLEDCFDFKRKFYSVKCLSSSAELKCIKINDLLKIIWSLNKDEYMYILNFIMDKKNILKNQIINAVKGLEKKILFGLDIRYENLINYNKTPNSVSLKEKLKNNYFDKGKYNNKHETEINRVVSAIKYKGYKMHLQDILDEKINILTPDNTLKEKKELQNIKKLNYNILKILLKDRKNDHHLLKFTKTVCRPFISYELKDIPFSSGSSPINKFINDERINNNNIGKNIDKIKRMSILKNNLFIINKNSTISTSQSLSSNKRKITFLNKNNKTRSKSVFNFNKINKNPLIKFHSISGQRNQTKNKIINTLGRKNTKSIVRSISLDTFNNNSRILQACISPRLRLENRREGIFSTIRKAPFANKIMVNEGGLSKNKNFFQDMKKSNIIDEKEKIFPSNFRANLDNRQKTFINKKVTFHFEKINLKK